MRNFLSSIANFFKALVRDYGLGAVIILGACALGLTDLGLFLNVEVSSRILYLAIAITFMIFYMPALWNKILIALGIKKAEEK